MSFQTLEDSGRAAAELMGVDYERQIVPLVEPHIVISDTVRDSSGIEVPFMVSFSGPDGQDLIAKGGGRMDNHFSGIAEAEETVKELSGEMLYKLAARGLHRPSTGKLWRGGKLVIVKNGRDPLDGKIDVIERIVPRLIDAGIAGHDRYVTAGDGGVSQPMIDAYVREYHRLRPGDPYWRAVATGQSPELGGDKSDFRRWATSLGGYVTQRTLMEARGETECLTSIMGFGQVGGGHAYFASNDPEHHIRINGISDADGVLSTNDPEGIVVTEDMFLGIADNPKFTGSKIHALQRMVAINQPGLRTGINDDPGSIITLPTHYFVPATPLKDVIHDDNVASLGAECGVIEEGNGQTTHRAHQYLVDRGIDVAPDIEANGAGVDYSIKGWEANVWGKNISPKDLQLALADSSENITWDMIRSAHNLGTPDLRVGVAAIAIASMLGDTEMLSVLTAA